MRTNDPARPAPVGPAAARAPAVGRSAFAAAIALLLIAPDSRAGGAFISGDDSDANGHCEEDNCGRMIGHVLRDLYERCEPLPPGDCILAVGANADQALSALVGGQGRLGWNSPVNGGPGACVVHCDSVPCILGVDFADYRLLYVPSDEHDTSGGITQEQLDALITRQADIQAWVNDRDGRVLALTESRLDNPFGWLPNPLTFDLISTNDARRTPDPANPAVAEIDQEFPGNGSTDDNIDHNRYHNMFVGPSGWSGMRVLLEATDESIDDPVDPDRRIPAPLAVGCCSCLLIAEDCSNGVDDDGDGLVDEKDEDCTPCGDGVLDPGEECDDGNLRNGDGCDVRCRVEDNGPPACSLPAAFAADCRDVRDGLFRLDGSGASDPDGDPLHLHWSAQCPEISFQDDEDEFPVVLADGPPPCPSPAA